MALEYYVIDTETTGLKPGFHETVEISIIRCSDRSEYSRFIKAEHPDRASIQALEITGKSIDDLKKGDSKLEVVNGANAFFAKDGVASTHRCIIAHNASFDKNFCHALWGDVGEVFPALCWMDTKPFAREWSKKLGIEKPKLSLAAVIEFTGITPVTGGVHNAIADAQNTYLLWKKGMAEGIDHVSYIKQYEHVLNND